MANRALVLLLVISAQQALAEDVQQLNEGLLEDDFESMILMQQEDLGIDNSRILQRGNLPPSGPFPPLPTSTIYPPGEHKLNFGDFGYFTSPDFPRDYPNDIRAKWIFRCIGDTIRTSCFTRIRTSPGCRKDFLALFTRKGFNDGTRYCGRNDRLQGEFPNRLKATFKSNATIRNKGFVCTFTCGNIPTTTAATTTTTTAATTTTDATTTASTTTAASTTTTSPA